MDAIAVDLADYLIDHLGKTASDVRILVGISGIPASGKSTLAELVVDKTNERLSSSAERVIVTNSGIDSAILIGLDGWHLTRNQLDAFPDPKLAHDRRGIHWTFDGESYVSFVKSIRQPLSYLQPESPAITAPSFDHARKDPTPHAVTILPEHRIVVIEGLYTFLAIQPWVEAAKLLDERWFVEVDIDEASQRLVKRHVVSGVAKDLEEAQWRADENDMPNGKFIIANMLEPTRVIKSVDDPVFAIP